MQGVLGCVFVEIYESLRKNCTLHVRKQFGIIYIAIKGGFALGRNELACEL